MKYIRLIIVGLFLSLFGVLHANEVDAAYQEVSIVLPLLDDMSVPDGFDSNLDSLLYVFRENTNMFDDCVSAETGEMLPDSIYIKRLQQIPAIMELSYNSIVRRYIEVYTVKRRKQVEYMLGIGKYYFPIFEQALDIAGLPLELKYLPVIESALNPKAFSKAGASGLWQFMYSTGKIYGLEGNSLVDERRDPIKSTTAAVKYLKDLYNIYNDWALVIAAYNCGPGNVNKAIRKAGGKRDYWAIYNYLPRETRGYVPAFIAATYTMTYYKEHDFCAAPIEIPVSCDTLMFSERIHLIQIAEVLDIELSVLQSLNPQYRRDVIPGNGVPYTLCLPQTHINNFLDKKNEIMAHKATELNTNRVVVEPAAGDPYYGQKTYKVRKGDTLSIIAKRNKVSVAQIKKLNNLRSDNIRVGQNLRLR
jgi:membrane-bound lytic murein transglycosylase D